MAQSSRYAQRTALSKVPRFEDDRGGLRRFGKELLEIVARDYRRITQSIGLSANFSYRIYSSESSRLLRNLIDEGLWSRLNDTDSYEDLTM